MSNKYKIRDQHGLNYLTCTICGWVDLFTSAEYRDIVLDSWRYCSQHKGLPFIINLQNASENRHKNERILLYVCSH